MWSSVQGQQQQKKSSNPQKVVGLSRVAHKTPSVLYLLPYLSPEHVTARLLNLAHMKEGHSRSRSALNKARSRVGGSSERSACSAHCLDFHLKACRPGRAETGIAAAHDRAPNAAQSPSTLPGVTHLGLSCPGTLWLFLETQPVGCPGFTRWSHTHNRHQCVTLSIQIKITDRNDFKIGHSLASSCSYSCSVNCSIW